MFAKVWGWLGLGWLGTLGTLSLRNAEDVFIRNQGTRLEQLFGGWRLFFGWKFQGSLYEPGSKLLVLGMVIPPTIGLMTIPYYMDI